MTHARDTVRSGQRQTTIEDIRVQHVPTYRRRSRNHDRMTLQFTAAHSSRITKSKAINPLLRRSSSSSSAFASFSRKKPTVARANRKPSQGDDEDDDFFGSSSRLEDHGLVLALATDLRLRDVAQQLRYIQEHMFDKIPECSGLNSTRTAEVLNFRKNLAPIVTVAHLHALSRSSTTTEREIAELVRNGVVRRINIPYRGVGASAIGESLVLGEKWIEMVSSTSSLEEEVQEKYIAALRANPTATAVPQGTFTPKEAASLLKAGFVTSAATVYNSLSHMLKPDSSSTGTLASLSTAGYRSAAGSIDAVGGSGAIYEVGGGGHGAGLVDRPASPGIQFNFSLPSIGPYLRLLDSARAYLISVLMKSKYKEAPQNMLKERWDGALSNTERGSRGKEFSEIVLPARTKKWKQFNGLRFSWVLEECMGTGLVEVFQTPVGRGVRMT
jgi:hypothetical protein